MGTCREAAQFLIPFFGFLGGKRLFFVVFHSSSFLGRFALYALSMRSKSFFIKN
jgi:hypothetical protein